MDEIYNSFTSVRFYGLSGHKAYNKQGEVVATMEIRQQQGTQIEPHIHLESTFMDSTESILHHLTHFNHVYTMACRFY